MNQPTLRTPSLVLRPFTLADAPRVQQLAGDYEVASMTAHIPHPYLDGMAEEWIGGHAEAWREQRVVTFAIVALDGDLRGAIGLELTMAHLRGSLGYWVGAPFWNRGIASEAARALIAFGFDTLKLHRIDATHLTRNPASGRVMQNAGMQFEGIHRGIFKRDERFEDLAHYAILVTDRDLAR